MPRRQELNKERSVLKEPRQEQPAAAIRRRAIQQEAAAAAAAAAICSQKELDRTGRGKQRRN